MESNMNENNKKSITEITVDTVEVPKELIVNLKNIIEVVNTRITWKTSELLPIGLICKQLDEIIQKEEGEPLSQ